MQHLTNLSLKNFMQNDDMSYFLRMETIFITFITSATGYIFASASPLSDNSINLEVFWWKFEVSDVWLPIKYYSLVLIRITIRIQEF